MALARLLGTAAVLAALVSVTPVAVRAHSEEDLEHMGPLGVMWPPDREWSEDEGRNAPCGSAAGVGERTDFPLTGGSLALEQKDVVYDLEVYISYSKDPKSNDDFTLLSPHPVPSLSFSHVCVAAPPLTEDATSPPGGDATLQFRYVAAYLDPAHAHRRMRRHLPSNETFYACSDVRLVEPAAFTFEVPCFNVTGGLSGGLEHDHGEDDEDGGVDREDEDDEGAAGKSESGSGNGGGGLSKEGIAGVVIGCVVGVAMIGTLAWYLVRRDRREKAVAQHIVQAAEK